MTDHARQRAWERYGLVLSDHDIDAIRATIECGNAITEGVQSQDRVVCLVAYAGMVIRPVYSRSTGAIVSILDREHRMARAEHRVPLRARRAKPTRREQNRLQRALKKGETP